VDLFVPKHYHAHALFIIITNQIKFDHNTKNTTSITKPREKKYTNHHKTTNKDSEPINPIKKIKIKTTILVITHTTNPQIELKSKRGKKKIASFIHKPP
jgi:hypothetical protein